MRVSRTVLFCAAVFCVMRPHDSSAQPNRADVSSGPTQEQQSAITLLEQGAAAHPMDGATWEHLGAAYQRAGRYDQALKTFQKAIDNGFDPSLGKYHLACAYARLGDQSHAVSLLAEAVGAGFAGDLSGQADLSSLQGNSKFQEIVKSAEAQKHPCKDSQTHPEYRQLDFWVGSWEVFSAKQKEGTSEVKLILSDCVISENWKDIYGGEGKSFNKYNNDTHKWEQFWVEDDGSTQYFTGELTAGEMKYVFDQQNETGVRVIRHLTFSKLSDNRVRQLSQKSMDGGKTWANEYDLTYVPLKRN